MQELQVLVGFGGFVALLLWGLRMVQTGVQRAFGKVFGRWVAHATGSRPRSFTAGLAITAATQSSTATSLMITGFALDGMVSLVPGLAAMLGANVGTTLIVQVLSFNPAPLAPILILAGVWMFRRYAPGRTRDLGRVFTGLGLVLLALHELVTLFQPLQNAPLLVGTLQALAGLPLLALAVGIALTWVLHSSVAIVVLVMALAHHGLAGPELAYVLVLGANVGTAINPVREGGQAGNPASRRLPLGNLGTRIAGCAIALAILPWAGSIMAALGPDPSHEVANFHLVFNLAVAACFMPLLSPYARGLQRLLPRRVDPDDPARPQHLDDSAREVPAVALGQATRECQRLAGVLRESLQLTQRALLRDDRSAIGQARYLNGIVGQLDQSITAYLATQDQEGLNADDEQTLKAILAFSTNIAHAASVSGMGLLGHAGRLHKKRWQFDAEQQVEMAGVMDRLQDNLTRASGLLASGDRQAARELAFEKDYFRDLEARAAERHLDRIKAGRVDAADEGAFYLDVLRDIGGVNSYLVNAAAYPVLARYGELRPNRLRETD